jgi:hypothetical protein
LEILFEKQDEMIGHMLEVELNTLDPKSFDNIHDLFTKFKSLILSLTNCGIDKSKQVDQLILTILAKLGPEYVVYVSTFHSSRCLMGTNWKMPTMDQFIDSLTHEQEKLIHMGLIEDPKAHAVTMHDGKKIIQTERKGDITTSRAKEGGIFQNLQGIFKFRFERFFRFRFQREEEEEGKTMHLLQ